MSHQSDERVFLTFEEASAMLLEGGSVHTFRNPAPGLMLGCDWDREEILKVLRDGKPELAGESATSMGHGLVVIDGSGPLFIETRRPDAVLAHEITEAVK